jgi:hypothetical protein
MEPSGYTNKTIPMIDIKINSIRKKDNINRTSLEVCDSIY